MSKYWKTNYVNASWKRMCNRKVENACVNTSWKHMCKCKVENECVNSSRKRMWKCKVENECINATLKRLCKRKVERYRVIIKCNWKRFWKCPIFTEKIFFTFVHILEKRFCSNLCHLTIVGFWQKMIWQKLSLFLSFFTLFLAKKWTFWLEQEKVFEIKLSA